MKWTNKIQALIVALAVQLCFMALIFFGGLLDPLVGLWVAAFYFFLVGTYSIYRLVLGYFDNYRNSNV